MAPPWPSRSPDPFALLIPLRLRHPLGRSFPPTVGKIYTLGVWEGLRTGRSYTLGGASHFEELCTGKSYTMGGAKHGKTYTWEELGTRRSPIPGGATHWDELRTGRRELFTGRSYALEGATHGKKQK